MFVRNLLKSCIVSFAIISASLCDAPHAYAQAPQSVPGATTLDSDGVIALIEQSSNLVIIDARHEKDFLDGHIEGAHRLLDDDMIGTGPTALATVSPDKAAPLLFYCNGPGCGRAAKSAAAAIGWGYSKVNYYYAGIPDWRAKNLPLVK